MSLPGSEALASTISAVEAALWASDMPRAMRLSEEAVGAGVVHPTLLSLTALKRMQAGDNAGALPLLLRAREMTPQHVDLLNALGTWLNRLDRPREAVEAFDAALSLSSSMGSLQDSKCAARPILIGSLHHRDNTHTGLPFPADT